MTDEEAFQVALDANPDDAMLRMIFADWLEERGDPRAEGYRALGVNGRYPFIEFLKDKCPWYARAESPGDAPWRLPLDWFDAIKLRGKRGKFAPHHKLRTNCTRCELEDAAALAFSRLPAARRAELLGTLTPA